MRIVDLRSDTVTKPTPRMLEAMVKAELGDDGYREDPTVNKLEEMAAQRLGKEAGLFLTSGTMANLVTILVQTRPGEGVICDNNSHLHKLTLGSAQAFAGVQFYPINSDTLGRLDLTELEKTLNLDHRFPRASLLVVENTNNWAGGTVLSPEETQKLARIAKKYGLKFHLDGARVFNAAVALRKDPRELTKDCDTAMFCLSKSLCCPIGSVLVGPKDFIEQARRVRRMLGGGMRQAGVIAACGIVALEELIDRLDEDHRNAKRLAEGLAKIHPPVVNLSTVQTNIVCFEFNSPEMDCKTLIKRLADRGVRVMYLQNNRGRMVAHKDVNEEDIDYALEIIESVLSRELQAVK